MAILFTDHDRGWADILAAFRGSVSYNIGVRLNDSPRHLENEMLSPQVSGRLRVALRAQGARLATNAQLAMVHEFGAGHSPPRSFLRSTMDENREKYLRLLRVLVEQSLTGRLEVRDGCRLIAEEYLKDVKKKILGGIPPENTPGYLSDHKNRRRSREARRRNKVPVSNAPPLIDSGQLFNSLSVWINPEGLERGGPINRSAVHYDFYNTP